MKKKLRNAALGVIITILLLAACLLFAIIHPTLFYSYQSDYRNFTIYHNRPLDLHLIIQLDRATELSQGSELYDENLKYDLCLNDGSVYPKLVRAIRGDAFAWGFYHQLVLGSDADFKRNLARKEMYRWNLSQLLAHEAMHCQTYNTFGFWKSNPVAEIPDWKWEGYPEYISRQLEDQKDLARNISRLESAGKNNWILFADHTGAPRTYYKSWLLVQFCMDIKKMTFIQLLHSRASEQDISKEMLRWYEKEVADQKTDHDN